MTYGFACRRVEGSTDGKEGQSIAQQTFDVFSYVFGLFCEIFSFEKIARDAICMLRKAVAIF